MTLKPTRYKAPGLHLAARPLSRPTGLEPDREWKGIRSHRANRVEMRPVCNGARVSAVNQGFSASPGGGCPRYNPECRSRLKPFKIELHHTLARRKHR